MHPHQFTAADALTVIAACQHTLDTHRRLRIARPPLPHLRAEYERSWREHDGLYSAAIYAARAVQDYLAGHDGFDAAHGELEAALDALPAPFVDYALGDLRRAAA